MVRSRLPLKLFSILLFGSFFPRVFILNAVAAPVTVVGIPNNHLAGVNIFYKRNDFLKSENFQDDIQTSATPTSEEKNHHPNDPDPFHDPSKRDSLSNLGNLQERIQASAKQASGIKQPDGLFDGLGKLFQFIPKILQKIRGGSKKDSNKASNDVPNKASNNVPNKAPIKDSNKASTSNSNKASTSNFNKAPTSDSNKDPNKASSPTKPPTKPKLPLPVYPDYAACYAAINTQGKTVVYYTNLHPKSAALTFAKHRVDGIVLGNALPKGFMRKETWGVDDHEGKEFTAFLERVSLALSRKSEGTVYFVTSKEGPKADSIWKTIEEPALHANPRVDRIVRVESEDLTKEYHDFWVRG